MFRALPPPSLLRVVVATVFVLPSLALAPAAFVRVFVVTVCLHQTLAPFYGRRAISSLSCSAIGRCMGNAESICPLEFLSLLLGAMENSHRRFAPVYGSRRIPPLGYTHSTQIYSRLRFHKLVLNQGFHCTCRCRGANQVVG